MKDNFTTANDHLLDSHRHTSTMSRPSRCHNSLTALILKTTLPSSSLLAQCATFHRLDCPRKTIGKMDTTLDPKPRLCGWKMGMKYRPNINGINELINRYAGWGLGHFQKPYLRSLTSHLIPKGLCAKKFNWAHDQLSSNHLCVSPPINGIVLMGSPEVN